MKVCLIGNVRVGHLRRFATAYRDAGIDTHVLSIRSADLPGCHVRSVHVGRANSPSAPATAASYLRLAAEARRHLGAIDPDVVHAHYVTTSGVIAGLSGFGPIVVSAWGSDVIPKDGVAHPRWKPPLIRAGLSRARIVTTTSRYMGTWIERVRPGLDLRHTPFGVDVDAFAPPPPAPARPFTVGIAKSLEDKYGHEHLLDAFARLSRDVPDAVLRIAGDGRLRASLEDRARALGIAGRVEFLGSLPHDEIPAFLASLDVAVNATVVAESFGVAILEASATAVPVVATDVGGVRETCVDGETGLLVPAGDAGALAEALGRLARDPDERARLGCAGRQFVTEHYRWQDSVDTMLGILHELAG